MYAAPAMQRHGNLGQVSKEELRRALTRARRARPAKREEDAALAAQCLRLLGRCSPGPVAAYHPLPSEPGHGALLPALRGTGRDIYLPISLPGGRLAWALDGPSRPGHLGIPEPVGPRRGTEALASCALVLVPTLGISPEGYRLGKGGGYYDRALATLTALAPPRPPIAALAYPEEIIPVPVEPHDQAVDYIVEPGGWRAKSKGV